MRMKKIMKKITACLCSAVLAVSALVGGGGENFFSSEDTVEQVSATSSNFRREVSADSPMLIVHIDSWNYADPAKIIELIPEDVRPYVVFNISLSINWDSTNHKWLMVQDGYECAKSWLRTCADMGVWTMIQPSSGGQSHFPDYGADEDLDNTIYGEFFRDYPNFLGYNYCEQFWGFESADFPITCKERYQHFATLLKLCNKYGGYLDVSWCANQWSAAINPIAMLKTVPEWESACSQYSDNYILEEKYTQASYIEDVESEVFGMYVSGYCGNWGVRYDETGWTDSTWSGTGTATKDQYRVSTGLPVLLERMVKEGCTVIDGPELVWADDFKETWGTTDSNGYHERQWAMYDQYQNDILDLFRKVEDGTIVISSREEVIQDTKAVIIQDVSSGSNDDKYSTYSTLFEGLYRMDSDGNLKDNHNLYKSTGRYGTIPTVYKLKDSLAQSIPTQIKQSTISSRWADIAAKQTEFNKLYPNANYWGNCYAGRDENTWVAYNPYKDGTAAGGYLSLQYNTCKQIEVTFSQYASSVITESTNGLDIYVNNYDEEAATTLKTNTFKIYGCSAEPTITYKDRGVNQTASQITTSFADGTYTITVKHNGPVDISVKCSGAETRTATAYNTAHLSEPAYPSAYTGIRQYEGEFFDTKNIDSNVTNGCSSGVTGYYGQGFLKFGTKNTAAIQDTVNTQVAGKFTFSLRYATTAACNLDLYVNNTKVTTLALSACSSYSDWKTVNATISMNAGANTVEVKSTGTLAASPYLDCFTVEGTFISQQAATTTATTAATTTTTTTTTPAEPVVLNGTLIQNCTVYDTDNATDWSIQNNFSENALIYGDRNITVSSYPTQLTGAEYIRTACDSKLYTDTEAAFTAGANMIVSVAVDDRVASQLTWLNTWTATSDSVVTSNDVTLNIYQLSVSKGDTVTLGTNGGYGLSANYIVFATNSYEKTITTTDVKGDINADGEFNIADLVLLQKWLIAIPNITIANWQAGDLFENSQLDGMDLCIMRQMLIEESTEVTPDEYMARYSSQVTEFESSDSTTEKSGVQYGAYQKVTFTSSVCGGRSKSFNVLLPAGYSTSKKYPVLYAMHGYWGNSDSLLDAGDSSLKLRQIIGNAIADGEAEDMIVVFPDIYASATQDACDGLNDTNNKAYDNFINELTQEIMPYMEQHYSIKTGRENTAITGFSMGGRESLYIGLTRPDLFGYVGAMCPAPGLNTDLIPTDQMKFDDVTPYLLMISAGSNDQVVYSTPSGYHDTLTSNGVNHIWHYVTGGDHGGVTIRAHMYNFVRFIFKA